MQTLYIIGIIIAWILPAWFVHQLLMLEIRELKKTQMTEAHAFALEQVYQYYQKKKAQEKRELRDKSIR